MSFSSGRLFRILVICLLGGVFVELLVLLGFLFGHEHPRGDIAVVELRGTIDDSLRVVEDLKKYAKEEGIKAIVFRIDSPGGTVGSSQEIHDEVMKISKTKKIVASLGDVAASGGYYAAVAASKIVANPGTVTGSIGVISHHFVIEDLLKRFHVRWEVIAAGKMKDVGSPLRSMTKEERRLLANLTKDMHAQFMAAVAQGRRLPLEKVKEFADGRILTGRQAKDLGLVDELGGLERAIEMAAGMVGIVGEPKVIYPERMALGWLRKLAEGKIEAPSIKIGYRMAP